MSRFGLTLPQRGVFFGATTPAQMLELAQAADESGMFGSVWVGDSITAKPRPDSIALLGALAGVTRNVKLGVGCMASFPVRDPIVFAYQWATLDLLSQGRMLLAACTGLVKPTASEHEGRPFGVPDRERAARMEENIEICRLLWTSQRASFRGRFRSFEDVTIEPRPVTPPPIWIAANPSPGPFMEKSMQRVATLADGWMSANVFPGLFGMLWERLAPQVGADFPTIAYHNVCVGTDRDACLAESKRFLDEYYGPVFSPDMVEAWTAAGTPDECAASIRSLLDAGAKQVTLRITAWDQDGQYKRLTSEVLPAV